MTKKQIQQKIDHNTSWLLYINQFGVGLHGMHTASRVARNYEYKIRKYKLMLAVHSGE